jgi:AAA family ATP:ADP antiporter
MKPSWLDRSLRVFTDVRAGEGATALLMFANVFLILCAYYFIKPLREGWISVSGITGLSKMEVKAYTSFGQSLLLIPTVWAYGWLSERWRRSHLITCSTLFCMTNMAIFWALQPGFFIENLPFTGIAFYLWVGMFGVFIVAQFWAFAADLYSDERGTRLLPLIAVGATAGAASGSWITSVLVEAGLFGTEWLLMVAMLPLLASMVLSHIVDRRLPRAARVTSPPAPERHRAGRSAIAIVFSSRFLLATAIITLLLSWVNTNGENLLFRVVQEFLNAQALEQGISNPDKVLLFTRDGTTAFYGDFFFWVNIMALLLQAFVASRLLKYGGFGALLLTMPLVALLSYSAMALVPILLIIKMMKIAENSTDYSINNTARHVLWLPVSAELTYKGKPTIDSLFVRVGDGIAALTVLVGVHLLALATQSFFIVNIALILVWIAFACVVIRHHRQLSQRHVEQGVD